MKKHIFAIIAFVGIIQIKAQNLTYNSVFKIDIPPSSTITITVPANKVWKVESIGGILCRPTSTTCPLSYGNLNINGTLIQVCGGFGFNASQFNSVTSTCMTLLPLWLPSGSYTLSTSNCPAFISGIEFNQ